jgi:formylglycine-generating enzyme required for sulfatase activity
MKRILSVILVSFLGVILSSFSKTNAKVTLPKEFKDLKVVSYIPMAEHDEKEISSYFMFSNEVTNIDYKEFVYWIKTNGTTEELNTVKVDTCLWKNISIEGNDYLCENYKKWASFPVVNISKEAAVKYCEWLSKIWNEKQNEYKVTFRLPTKTEWEYAACGGLNKIEYPWGGPNVKNNKNCYLAQFKAFGLKLGPVEVKSYAPNNYGLYDMSGNVAEMVQEGIVKGGSWNSNSKEISIEYDGEYEKSPYVGFRPIMELKKR